MALDQEFDEELEEGIEGKEMTFVEHLEELRWHLLRSIASILIPDGYGDQQQDAI